MHYDSCYQLLNNKQLHGIRNNYYELLRLIDAKHGLIAKLYAANVLIDRHKECVEAGDSGTEVNRRLLNILMRRSVADFNKFLECLVEHQSHLVPLFQSGSGKQYLQAYLFILNFWKH